MRRSYVERNADAIAAASNHASTISISFLRICTELMQTADALPGICTDRKFNEQVAWGEQCDTVAELNVRRCVNRSHPEG
jgi:hypothetical protein